jgi:hypothetical protein
MSNVMDDVIKRPITRRKSSRVLDIIQGETTMAEAGRSREGRSNRRSQQPQQFLHQR